MLGGADDSVRHRNGRNANRVDLRHFPAAPLAVCAVHFVSGIVDHHDYHAGDLLSDCAEESPQPGSSRIKKKKKKTKARKTADKSIFKWNYPRLCDKMAVCEEAGRRYRDTCLLLCEKRREREHMKKFYAWYQKHITGAIFTGLILGILTGLLLADRFTPILTVTGVIGGIYMNALNMMIFPMVFCSIVMGICSIGNAKTTGKITGYSMIFFLCTTAIASAVGIIIQD